MMGHLQIRGNNQRILHYQGFKEGKRVYIQHKLVITGNQSMVINKPDLALDKQNGGPVEIRTPDLWLVKPTS